MSKKFKTMDELVFLGQETGQAVTSSRKVAEVFEKEHFNVLRDIDNLLKSCNSLEMNENSKLSGHLFEEFYEQVPTPNGGTRKLRYYLMNRDGFTLLAMGFTGEKALKFKLAYIEAFNMMEEEIKQKQRIEGKQPDPLHKKIDAATWAVSSLKMTQREKRALGNEILVMAGMSPLPDLPVRVRPRKASKPSPQAFKPAPYKNMYDKDFSCPIDHREMKRFLPRELRYYIENNYIEKMMHAGAVRRVSTISTVNGIVIDNYELSDEWSYYGWNKKDRHLSGMERTIPYFYSSRVEELVLKINSILETNPIVNI